MQTNQVLLVQQKNFNFWRLSNSLNFTFLWIWNIKVASQVGMVPPPQKKTVRLVPSAMNSWKVENWAYVELAAFYVKNLSCWLLKWLFFCDKCLPDKSWWCWAGALVLWLWVITHVREIMGLNPGAVYWMDIFHIDLLWNIVLFVWKEPKIDEKRGRGWPIKNLWCIVVGQWLWLSW